MGETHRPPLEPLIHFPLATSLTDYPSVDQEVFEEGSDVVFSSHVESAAFSRTTELTVVADSDVVRSMGRE